MNIINYDSERAAKKCNGNNERVKRENKIEWIGYIIKGIILIFMNLCIIAMCSCVVAMFCIDSTIMNNPIIYLMIACIAMGVIISIVFLKNRKLNYCSESYYDNSETQYYRLQNKYKKVTLFVDSDNKVSAVCEDNDRCISAYSIIPKSIKSSDKIKVPTFDMKYDCLWMPV